MLKVLWQEKSLNFITLITTKMKTHKELINEWEHHTEGLAEEFARKYFGKDNENWWVAGEIGGVLCVNDHFFNLDRIIEALKYRATITQLFMYYELELEAGMKKPYKEKSITEIIGYNFKSYLKIEKNEKTI